MMECCRDRLRHGCDYARVRLREQLQTARRVRTLASPFLPVGLARRVGVRGRAA